MVAGPDLTLSAIGRPEVAEGDGTVNEAAPKVLVAIEENVPMVCVALLTLKLVVTSVAAL